MKEENAIPMKQILLPTYELVTLGVFTALVVTLWTVKRERPGAFGTVAGARLTTITALALVSVGEALNAFVFQATIYSECFLVWIPFSGVPLFILCDGVIVSLLLYTVANGLANALKTSNLIIKIALCVVASFVAPLLERLGIALDFWRWGSGVQFDVAWHLGVWKFYFVFIAIPAIIGLCVEQSPQNECTDKKKRDHSEDFKEFKGVWTHEEPRRIREAINEFDVANAEDWD